MSSKHVLRKENNCLNCGNEVNGKFCSECGQLNREPHMGLNDLFHDLLHSILHFDGKFFNTIKFLITKPGYLTKEYILGRRARYLPPVQMYLFTSAVFFFLLYTFFLHAPEPDIKANKNEIKAAEDPIKINLVDSLPKLSSLEDYYQVQATLPKDQKDSFIKKYFTELQLKLNEKFRKDPKGSLFELLDHFIHSFSSLFFVSLPLIALWLNLLFFRQKQHNIVTHFIFLIHNYVFDYVAIFLQLLFNSLASLKGLGFLGYASIFMVLWMFVYGFRSMKNFYQLSNRKAIWKYSLALLGSSFIMIALIIIYLMISFIKTI